MSDMMNSSANLSDSPSLPEKLPEPTLSSPVEQAPPIADDAAVATTLLQRKRDSLLAEAATRRAEAARAEADALRAEAAASSIEAALRLLDPKATPAPMPLLARHGGAIADRVVSAADGVVRFERGECLALMKEVLREAPRPPTTTELVRAVMAKKGLPPSDEDGARLAVRYAMKRVGSGIVPADADGGWPRWRLHE